MFHHERKVSGSLCNDSPTSPVQLFEVCSPSFVLLTQWTHFGETEALCQMGNSDLHYHLIPTSPSQRQRSKLPSRCCRLDASVVQWWYMIPHDLTCGRPIGRPCGEVQMKQLGLDWPSLCAGEMVTSLWSVLQLKFQIHTLSAIQAVVLWHELWWLCSCHSCTNTPGMFIQLYRCVSVTKRSGASSLV